MGWSSRRWEACRRAGAPSLPCADRASRGERGRVRIVSGSAAQCCSRSCRRKQARCREAERPRTAGPGPARCVHTDSAGPAAPREIAAGLHATRIDHHPARRHTRANSPEYTRSRHQTNRRNLARTGPRTAGDVGEGCKERGRLLAPARQRGSLRVTHLCPWRRRRRRIRIGWLRRFG